MRTCFVIQPFDKGKFDKRFDDVFKPAIAAAGLDAYRVDQDPSAAVPITAIEREIKAAAICLADITMDNPNIWYELGFSFAAEKDVVLVCSKERVGNLPFDIQHRNVIQYSSESSSDFDALRDKITGRIRASLGQSSDLTRLVRDVREAEQSAPVSWTKGLTSIEVTTLAAICQVASMPKAATSVGLVRQNLERAGVNGAGFNLATMRLIEKGFLEESPIADDYGTSDGVLITDEGWRWISDNDDQFSVFQHAPPF